MHKASLVSSSYVFDLICAVNAMLPNLIRVNASWAIYITTLSCGCCVLGVLDDNVACLREDAHAGHGTLLNTLYPACN
jgi:hypothetical protein